jgi:hypothetical protein
MALEVASMEELRLEVLLEPERTGESVADVSERRGTSFCRYQRRFEEGAEGLEPRSCKPRTSPANRSLARGRDLHPAPVASALGCAQDLGRASPSRIRATRHLDRAPGAAAHHLLAGGRGRALVRRRSRLRGRAFPPAVLDPAQGRLERGRLLTQCVRQHRRALRRGTGTDRRAGQARARLLRAGTRPFALHPARAGAIKPESERRGRLTEKFERLS